jgi:hypothetical protein
LTTTARIPQTSINESMAVLSPEIIKLNLFIIFSLQI